MTFKVAKQSWLVSTICSYLRYRTWLWFGGMSVSLASVFSLRWERERQTDKKRRIEMKMEREMGGGEVKLVKKQDVKMLNNLNRERCGLPLREGEGAGEEEELVEEVMRLAQAEPTDVFFKAVL